MALVINDRVKETTTTTGTGAVAFGGAVTGFETFAAGIGNSNTTYYAIVHQTAAEFEVGLGTLDGDSSDLTRTTVISSSNSDSAVDFAAGTKDVFCTMPASKLVFEDASSDVTLPNDLILGSDSAVLKFGADSDTTLTHTDGTGLTLNSTNKLLFRDSALYINSSTDGQLDIVADTEVQIAATTIDINGAVALNGAITGATNITLSGELDAATLDISGDADIDGTLEADAITINGATLEETVTDFVGGMVSSNTETGITVTFQDADNTIDFALAAAQTTITSLLATDIKIGEDDQTKIDFETADEIHFYANNTEQVYLGDNIFGPQSDSDVDLGSTGVRWKDAFVDTITTTGNATVGGDLTVTGDDITMGTNTDTAILVADGTNYNPVVPSGDIGLTNAGVFSIASGVIVNADVNASAAIADSKLATISTANKVDIGALDIDGATDIGEALADADLFIVDNGAGGTNRKVTASRIKTYAGVSGDVTTIDSLLNTDIKIGEDDQTKIDFETADTIHFYAGNQNQIKLTNGVLAPVSDSDVDLGTSSLYFKDTFLDTIRTTGVAVFGSPTSASAGGYTGKVQVSEAGGNPSMTLNGNVGNDGGVALVLSKSRNATVGSNTIVADNDVVGSIFWAADDGSNMDSQPASIVCKIDGTPGGDDVPGELIFGTTADGAANPTQRFRITPTGVFARGTGPGTATNTSLVMMYSDCPGGGNGAMHLRNGHTDASGDILTIDANVNNDASIKMIACYGSASGNAFDDLEFAVKGNGAVSADGSFSGSGADYGEYFESKTGNAVTKGTTLVLDGKKVRASIDSDAASTIIGVARPKKNSKNSAVIGNAADNFWTDKYVTNDYGEYEMVEYTSITWTEPQWFDSDGKKHKEKLHSYFKEEMPADGTLLWGYKDPPADGTKGKTETTTHPDGSKLTRRKLNSSFNEDNTYVSREDRDEWILVGLMGQVQITKGQKTGDRWIKMRDISDTVEEWYIR